MSNPEHSSQLEHQRLLKLAREYRQKGYAVTLHPSPAELPPNLASCSFDLIAKGENKTIAVEVRTRENLTLNGSEDLRAMTSLVDQVPGWEFELVVTNPRKQVS
ncbi:hypothetical protein H6F43_18635 [Leptolyngbya sp. FACHB-36]|uniref:hypothetical protein n=1 Tax=Leptolyngbya sp. FACHB-36 TaxID=2692808 RepID=UPI0016803526|nr:hypothetical protein [Leptolyngbya sp. FACHB-36]MBD2022201.1 hypothetical protein [Leptolyngbya sp. FACHB-36]